MVQQGISNYPADSSSANPMHILRTVILSLCGILAVANMGIVIHWITITEEVLNLVVSFEIMGVITSIITLVLVPTFIIVARTRTNAWIVYTLTEIIVFGVVWILWVVAAALVIQQVNAFGDCSRFQAPLSEICTELVAIEGLSVTIFVLLLVYVLSLIILATVRSMSRGSGVWFQSVKELQAPPSNSTVYMTTLASQTTAPGSSDTWKDKPIPDAYAGVPVTVALPSTGPNVMGPSRSGYPTAPMASPYAEV